MKIRLDWTLALVLCLLVAAGCAMLNIPYVWDIFDVGFGAMIVVFFLVLLCD